MATTTTFFPPVTSTFFTTTAIPTEYPTTLPPTDFPTEFPTDFSTPTPTEGPMTRSIYLGVAISICGNLMISIALNIQKYSHNKNELIEKGKQVPYLKRPMWWLGMALMLGGEVGNFLAYGFAPASLVAPLGTVALVSNCIIAPFVLKEKFRVQDLIGIALAVGGAVLVVLYSSAESKVYTAEELKAIWKTTKTIVYLSLTFAAIIVLTYLSPKYGHRFLALDMLLVGIYAGYTVSATKAVSSLLNQGALEMFTEWIFYVMILMLVVTGVLQVRYLQKALQKFDSTEVIPTQFVMFTLFAILAGGVLYDDFENMSTMDILLFCVGIGLTFAGVYLISRGRGIRGAELLKKKDESEDDDAEDTTPTRSGDVYEQPLESKPAETLQEQMKGAVDSAFLAILDGIKNRQTPLELGAEQIRQNYLNENETIRMRKSGRKSGRKSITNANETNERTTLLASVKVDSPVPESPWAEQNEEKENIFEKLDNNDGAN